MRSSRSPTSLLRLEVIGRLPTSQNRKPPLLFVHGAWHGAWCWNENFLPYFAAYGHPAHALSLRGHGRSEGRGRLHHWRIKDYVQDLAGVVETFERPPVLIGHSMGALVVQKYLEEGSAAGVVLLAPVPISGLRPTLLKLARSHPWLFLRVLLRRNLYPLVATPELAREGLFSTQMTDAQVAHYQARLQNESFLSFLDMVLFVRARPGRLPRPPLVLGGTEDRFFAPAQIQATAEAYGTEAVIFPSMAHDMMLEARWQAVADRILEELAEL